MALLDLDVPQFLASIPLFRSLDLSILREISRELKFQHLPGGDTLFRQGDTGDSLYIVIAGRLRVFTENPIQGEQFIGEVGFAEVLGEMAILTEEPRSATVRAIRDTELLRLSREAFERLLNSNPQVMLQIARVIIGRLRQMMHSRRTDSMLRTVAVLPAGGEVSITAFCDRLVRAFASMGSTKHLNSTSFENHLGKGMAQTPLEGHQNSKVIGWLNEQEEKFCFVVYEADLSPSNWTKRCIRQADRIILVGDADSAPTLNRVEEEVPERSRTGSIAKSELVLLHQDKDHQPVETKKWLALRNVDKHHHVKINAQVDFERLTRTLTGKACGLVLGGGGARGFAHIGIIRALNEAKIPIDLVGGTSIGAIISALYAMGYDWEEIIKISRTCWIDMKPLKDYTIPLMSFITGNRINKMLDVMFGEKDILDLWVKYFCISANLTRAKMIVHEDGLLKKATRASISVPGVGPPLIDKGDLLVDGGVINNLPADVMREHCNGIIIAVDVSPVVDLTTNFEHLDSFSGVWALWNRINPFAEKLSFPSILRILMRASKVGSIQSVESTKKAADHYLHPPIDGIDMFNWNALDEIVEIGYRYAQEKITEWNDIST